MPHGRQRATGFRRHRHSARAERTGGSRRLCNVKSAKILAPRRRQRFTLASRRAHSRERGEGAGLSESDGVRRRWGRVLLRGSAGTRSAVVRTAVSHQRAKCDPASRNGHVAVVIGTIPPTARLVQPTASTQHTTRFAQVPHPNPAFHARLVFPKPRTWCKVRTPGAI